MSGLNPGLSCFQGVVRIMSTAWTIAQARGDAAIGVMSVDVEEWFHAHRLHVPENEWGTLPSRMERSVEQLLSLFTETRTTATFFVLGWVARRNPDVVRRIHRAGHEIASHGFGHRVIAGQTREEFRADLRRSKALIEDVIGEGVHGYRAPGYSVTKATWWALAEIRDAGYRYDSSVYPVRAPHGRYGVSGVPFHPFEALPGLREYPLPAVSLWGLQLPAVTGGYLRIWPMPVHRLALRQYRRRGWPVVMNVHPWELDPGQPRRRTGRWLGRCLHYAGLPRTHARLADLLARGSFLSFRRWALAQEAAVHARPREWVGAMQSFPRTHAATAPSTAV